MAVAVYILCMITSGFCAFLLLKAARRSKGPFLLWSGVAFLFFALANLMLFIDLAVVTNVDLRLFRNLISFAGVSTLLFGLIWETR